MKALLLSFLLLCAACSRGELAGVESAPLEEKSQLPPRSGESHPNYGVSRQSLSVEDSGITKGASRSTPDRKTRKGRKVKGPACEVKGAPAECPEPEVTYKPGLPKLGHYTVDKMCQPIHDDTAAAVTLGDGETLPAAYQRLKHESHGLGGVIRIPWDVDTVQCDSLRVARNQVMSNGLTLKGIPGPEGQLPRFYCRSDKRDGTVPHNKVRGEFLLIGEYKGGPASALVENLHVDGYKTYINPPPQGRMVIRNNYFHHAFSNGIVFSNTMAEKDLHLEVCGNELSQTGKGNAEHGYYLHRNLTETASVKATLVDNLCHSTSYSSCYKSTANENTLINNRFYQSLDTDPSYTKRYSSMLVDITACSRTVIRGNEFYGDKPEARKYGDIIIGIRNRRMIVHGCDRPQGYDDMTGEPTHVGDYWDRKWWESLKGEHTFPTIIEGNLFVAGGAYGHKVYAINMWGTYPTKPHTTFGRTCFLETPDFWYERSRVFADHNVYRNFSDGYIYYNRPMGHNEKQCGYPLPPGPGVDLDMIEAGPAEKIER